MTHRYSFQDGNKVGSNNSHCQIFEFISRAECQLLREHSGLCDRKDWQYAPKENKKMT
jgi:hypothetical protein